MKSKVLLLLAVMMIISLVFVGCTTNDTNNDTPEDNTGEEAVVEPAILELGYVQWACANANSHMVKALLEDKFDVEVNLRDMEAGLLWQSIATGDIDFMVTAWLPTTHADYYAELQDQFVDLGPLYDGAAIGLVVPQYVTIDSIEELNDNADKFGGKIVGIDAGAGIMGCTNEALEEYGLTNFELTTSSGAAMTAELKAAYENEEWVVVTGWAPHWKFSAFDLKFLDDPKGVYGGAETINPITRLGFADDYPEINGFLDNYYLTDAQFGSLIETMEEYDDDLEAAKAWIADNQELVDSWFE